MFGAGAFMVLAVAGDHRAVRAQRVFQVRVVDVRTRLADAGADIPGAVGPVRIDEIFFSRECSLARKDGACDSGQGGDFGIFHGVVLCKKWIKSILAKASCTSSLVSTIADLNLLFCSLSRISKQDQKNSSKNNVRGRWRQNLAPTFKSNRTYRLDARW
jgi:hypothetical protein